MDQYITDSKQINLSSNSATTSNGSKNSVMLFNLNNILKKEEDIIYNLVSVIHAEIPVSFYTINSTNNIIVIKIGVGVNTSYTLTNGNKEPIIIIKKKPKKKIVVVESDSDDELVIKTKKSKDKQPIQPQQPVRQIKRYVPVFY